MGKNKVLKKALMELAQLHDDERRGAVSEIANLDEIFEKLAEIGAVDVDSLWRLGARAIASGRDAYWLAGYAGLWAIALGPGPKPQLCGATIYMQEWGSDGHNQVWDEWRISDWGGKDGQAMSAYACHGSELLNECKAAWDEVNDARTTMDRDNVLLGNPDTVNDPELRLEMGRVMEACVAGRWMNGFVLEKSDAAREAIRGALCELELDAVAPVKKAGAKANQVKKPRL